jgi:hypothetical protein
MACTKACVQPFIGSLDTIPSHLVQVVANRVEFVVMCMSVDGLSGDGIAE